jgi:predicted transcriptional regulator
MRAGQLVYGTDDRLDHLARETRRSSEQRPEPPISPEPKPEPVDEGLPG